MDTHAIILSVGFSAALVQSVALAQPATPLELAHTITLEGVRGRIDHLDIDLDRGRLFVAELGNNTVEVIDLATGRPSARLGSLQEPQGVAYVARGVRIFVTNGGGARVAIFASENLVSAGEIRNLDDADNVRYDAAADRLYVGYGRTLATIDPEKIQVEHRIELAGHPESFQLERNGSRIFVNVPDAHEIAVIDRIGQKQVSAWKLAEAANFPMALDEAHQRLFVATRRPAALLVFDTSTGKRIATLPIGGDADDLFYDSVRNRIYAICGEGSIDIVHQLDADHYRSSDRVKTVPGARTGLWVAARNALYVAVPAHGGSPAEIRVYSVRQ